MDSSTLPLTDSLTIMQSAEPASSPTNRSEDDDNSDSSIASSTTPMQFADLPDDILLEIASYLPKTLPGWTISLWYDIKQRFDPEKNAYYRTSNAASPVDLNRSILALASVNKRIRQVVFPTWLMRSQAILPIKAHSVMLKGLSETLRNHVR
jgi:hypothetical protein